MRYTAAEVNKESRGSILLSLANSILGPDCNNNDSDDTQEEAPPEAAVSAAVVVNGLADKAADQSVDKRDNDSCKFHRFFLLSIYAALQSNFIVKHKMTCFNSITLF